MNIFKALILTITALVLVSVQTQAARNRSPFEPLLDKRLAAIEAQATLSGDATVTSGGVVTIADGAIAEDDLTPATTEGLNASRIARVTYDVATDLGTVAAHPLGVTLPAKSIIKQVWFYTVTQFVDAGSGTVAIHCEDANNLYTATDVTGITVGTVTAGAADGGAVATFVGSIAAACEVTATVATAAQTAGKMVIYIEYFVAE